MMLFWKFWMIASSRLCLFRTIWFWCRWYLSELSFSLKKFSDWWMRASDLLLIFLRWYMILKLKWDRNLFQWAWWWLSFLIIMKYFRFLWFVIISMRKTVFSSSDYHFLKTWTIVMTHEFFIIDFIIVFDRIMFLEKVSNKM